MRKSTIEIKTAFEGCAEVCEEYKPVNSQRIMMDCDGVEFTREGHKADCKYTEFCKHIKRVIDILSEQTADNPLDEMFADSMEKLDGLGVEE